MPSEEITSGLEVLGKRIRSFRKRRFWSQQTLADKAGLSQSEISKIEKGQAKEPTQKTILQLAKGLEIEPEDLVRTTPFASLFGHVEILPIGIINEGQPILAYFASALTGLDDEAFLEIERLDQRVDEICRRYARYPLVLYRPRTKTSPRDNPKASPREVYDIDQDRVAASDLLILAAVFPSLGVGMELQLALQSCSSVLLLRKKGQHLSRMVLGCPARMEVVEYTDLDDLNNGIPPALDALVPSISEFRFSASLEHIVSTTNGLGNRIRHMRERRGLTNEDLARLVGLDTAYIEAIETKPEEVVNPSLQILRRLSRALSVADAFLITGHEIPIQHQNPLFAAHLKSLDAYATESKMPWSEYRELWADHVERYGQEFSVVGVDRRTDIGNRKYWIERHEALKKDHRKALLAAKTLL